MVDLLSFDYGKLGVKNLIKINPELDEISSLKAHLGLDIVLDALGL